MLVYFAGPLFCPSERSYNQSLAGKLEERGFTVFLPQRDGVEILKPPFSQMPTDEQCRTIFKLDRDQIMAADIFLFVLDGRVPDEGACVELGIAYGQKYHLRREKLLIGLHSDMRVAFEGHKVNAMIYGALDQLVDNEEELLAALEAYRSK